MLPVTLSEELELIEKCKIAVWMELYQTAIKVQSKFKLEFCKDPPPIATIIQIHKMFLTTGSVIKPEELSSRISGDSEQLLISISSSDIKEGNECRPSTELSLIEKWKNRPKIKIRKQPGHHPENFVSLLKEDEVENLKDYAEISVNEEDGGNVVKGKDIAPFICIHCGCKSVDEETHVTHLKSHSNSDFFQCPNCSFTCNNTSSLRSHKAQCKPVNSPDSKPCNEKREHFSSSCDECSLSFSSVASFLQHMTQSHKQQKFMCNKCNCIFLSEMSFHRHLLHHKNGKYANCSCHGLCESENVLVHSCGTRSSSEKPVKCYKCDYSSIYSLELLSHEKMHINTKIFQCDQCNYRTHRKTNLRDHKTIHSFDENIRFECHLCGQRFKTVRNLRYHVDKNHTDREFLECPFCDFRQKNKILLQIHMRRHTGEKPYRCSQPNCNFRARLSQELARHVQRDHAS